MNNERVSFVLGVSTNTAKAFWNVFLVYSDVGVDALHAMAHCPVLQHKVQGSLARPTSLYQSMWPAVVYTSRQTHMQSNTFNGNR